MSSATPGGLLVGDVDDDDVGELLVGDRARNRGAYRAGATDDCHFTVHESSLTIAPAFDDRTD